MESGSKQSQTRDSGYMVGKSSTFKFCQETDLPSDPGSNKKWATCSDMAAEDVEDAVEAAYQAFQKYRIVNPKQRADLLMRWDTLIREHKDDLAIILVHETGKPLAEAHGEIEYAASFTRWFAGEAERITGTNFTAAAPGRRVFTIKQPLGVAAAMVPWNFPIAYVKSPRLPIYPF